MSNQPTCLKCGAPLAGDARQGFCPRCLFLQASAGMVDPGPGAGADPSPENAAPQVAPPPSHLGEPAPSIRPPPSASPLPQSFGDYQFLEEIGHGGMGVVYRARQRSLDRVVALKMMAFAPDSSPELVKRFRAEAVSAASLHHPHIVAIHEVGIHEGQHFFVMDYVEGPSLAQRISDLRFRISDFKQSVQWMKTVAEAVHYAHERGILHRDLKPSNVLIDAQDQPHVVDFGLARRLEGESELTVTGQVLGSPHYLPPEQATGQRARVSRRADVYALGATLYHLLTGRPPFQAESLAQTLDLVLHADPVAPRLLNPNVPRDLETICLKCLEKELSRRYATAQELADELARFQAGDPIHARPIGPAGKVWRWCRRKPSLAAAMSVALLSLLVGVVGIAVQWRRAEVQRVRAVGSEQSLQRRTYIAEISSAQLALRDLNPRRALELLNRHPPAGLPLATDPRGFEWRYLWRQCQNEAEKVIGKLSGRIRSLEVSPDGQWLFAGSQGGEPKLWNLATGEQVKVAEEADWAWGAFSPDGHTLASAAADQTWRLWDVPAHSSRRIYQVPADVFRLCFGPDGRNLFTGSGDGTILQWSLASQPPPPQPGVWRAPAAWEGTVIAPDGKHYAARRQGEVYLGSLQNQAPPDRLGELGTNNTSLLFSTDGQYLFAGTRSGDIRIWSLARHQLTRSLRGSAQPVVRLRQDAHGRVLLAAQWDTAYLPKFVCVWSARDWQEQGSHTVPGLGGDIASTDGKWLAARWNAQAVRVWSLAGNPLQTNTLSFPGEVLHLAFSPDGRRLAAANLAGAVRVWDVPRFDEWHDCQAHAHSVCALAFSPDSRRLATAAAGDNAVKLWDVDSWQELIRLPHEQVWLQELLFSVDGNQLVARTSSGDVLFWCAPSLAEIAQQEAHRARTK